MAQIVHYTIRYDSEKKVWHVMGKINSATGYCLELDFPSEKDARNEIYYLEHPEQRPKSK